MKEFDKELHGRVRRACVNLLYVPQVAAIISLPNFVYQTFGESLKLLARSYGPNLNCSDKENHMLAISNQIHGKLAHIHISVKRKK